MQRFLRGDAAPLGVLMQRHQTSLFRFCLRMLGDRSASEDATQEVFVKAVRGAKNWRPSAKVKTWLFSIARNHCIDELRKRTHRKTDSLEQPLKGAKEEGTSLGQTVRDSATPDPERSSMSKELRPRLIEALLALPEPQREVFLLREQAGLSFPEIASVLEVPENTVKSRMRYALQGLRKSLSVYGEET